MNSDSSSGKEFTQTKILKDSYIPLQKLESINENIPSAMESNVLSKTEALNLKTTTQKYFDDLAAVSRKLLNDIETAKKFYMKKDSIKPIDATQFIVECKNIACSLIKRTEANEKKLINQYSKWCKRTKVKNIFNNTIKNSQQIRKRSVSGTKERLSSSSSSSSSSDEEDEKKEETVVKKTIERELEVSECDSEQIFSEYETKKTKQASKFSSTDDKNKTKQNLETSGIETDSNENNSDIEAVFFSPQAGTSSLMKNSNSKQAEKSDESMEDIPVKMTPPVSRTKKITNISDDSAEDEVFSSPDLKKRKSNIISQESKKEAKTKKGIRRNIEKEREERVKAKLANSTSDSSDGEKTEFKVSHQAKKNKEIILNGISDSDDDGMTVEKTAKKNLPQTFDSSEDEEAELPTSGAEKIITNGVSDSEDTTDNTVGGNKKNSRKDGNSPKKSNGDKNAENQEKEAMDKIDSDSTDVDESAPKRPDLISDVSEGEATEPEDSKANKITKKNSGLKNKEKQKPASQQIDSDSTDVDESAPKKPGVISDASEGEATEPEASAINKLSKKNSDLENKKKQNKNINKIDSDSTDVDESAPKKPGVISDASEGEATEPEVSTTNKLSRKTSDLENKKKQKKDLNKIDSDSTDVDESVPKKPEVILDSSENKTTERETTKNSKKLLKNSADSEASTDVDETLSKKSKNPTESLDHDETESLQAPATDNSSSDQEEWADAEDIAGRKLHSRNSDSTEYEEFEPAPSNNSKEKEQLSSENSENSDDENGGPEKNELNNKETSNSVSKKTSSDQKSSDAEETVDKEEKLRKKLLEIDSSDEDDEQDSNVNETDKTIEHSYSKRKKNSSSQSSRNNSDSDSPKQKKKKLRPDNEENMKKKLLVSSSESDEEVDESSKNGNESPKQSAGNSQLDNEDNMKKKLLGSSSESDEEVDKSSKNGSESPKQSKENSQLDNEENMKKKLLGSSSESDEEAKKSGDSQASKNGSKSPKQSKGNSQLDNEENMKKKLLGSSSESDEVDKSSKNGSESPKQSKKNSHLNNEENMKKKLLGSSSESDEEAEKSDEDKSSNEKKKNNITALKDSFLRSRLSKKFRIKNNRYYKSDAKLRSKCMVKVQRIPPRNLRKHAKALKKSKEYVENKKLQSLIALDDLEKNRNRDRQMNSSSEEEETSTSTRNRRKKTAKESEETLMDHLKNLNNGDTMDVDDSASEDEEEPQNLPTINEEVTDLDEAADKIAQNNLLRDSESNSEEEAQDSDAEEEEEPKAKKESKKKSKPTVSSKNDSDIEMENEEEVKEGNKGKDDKGRWRRNALLTTNFSSSDSDEQAAKVEKKSSKLKSSQELEAGSDDETEKIKKNRIRRQRFNSDSDVKMTDLSSNSENDEEKLTKSDNEKSKKKRPRRKKGNDSSDSDLSSTKRGKQKAKRRRIKTADTESDDDDGSSVEEMNNSQGTPGKSGRKNIRRVLKDTKVADDTKQAAMQEEERLKRMSERQKIYNEMYEVRLAGEKKVDNLVLDFDEESKEELLSVHENLVKKLKPHQAQGIKFMWDACFESLERAKTTVGSGAILAHCMGLGKSFQIVTLSHTLLANYEKTNVKTVMVVCPLSTVLNWVNEFKIWLKEINDDEDEIEIYEMTKMKKNFERKYVLEEWQKKGGVLIIGYEMFRNLSSGAKKVTKKIRESFSRCLVDPGPDLVVCDEGHLLKSENTAISKAMSKIKTLRRIVLTGTPLQNNLIEYHCMVQFVKPNLLGTKKEFLNRFVNPINNGQFDDSTEYDVKLMKKRAHVLHKMLEGSVQRFDYSVLTPFLPPKQEYVIFIKLTEVQVKLYQYYIENLARRHRAAGGSLFADFQALQRIWTHPICIKLNADKDADRKRRNNDTDSEGSLKDFIDDDDDSDNSSSSVRSVSSISGSEGGRQRKNFKSTKSTRSNPLAEESIEEPQPDPEWWSQFVEEDHFEDMRISSKLLLLFDILKESENIGDKVLVFSQSLYSLTLIEKFLAMLDDETQKGVTSDYLDGHTGRWRLGLDYFRLDGGSSTENRSEWCKIFNRPTNTRARLFLISTRAGGLGINLTAANRVIIFDASWNPSHDVQSIFRIYRFGQKKPCYVYRLLAAGTMEEKIYNRQVTKLSLSCRVVDEQQIERHYSNNDLTELYKYEETTEETVSLALPKDRLLAEIFLRHKNLVRNYHEHDSLLENKAEEELDEEERKQAWREYEDEKAGRRQLGVPMMHYQDQMHQFNAQMMNQSISQLPEFEQIKQLIQKDYPTATPEQQMQITKQAMVNMYAFIENQHLMRNMQSPILTGRPPMQLPQAPMMNQISKPPNPTNTLANMLAQQEYARHHNTSSKKMSAQQKQIQYAQQFGNFRSVPVPSNARPAAAPTPQRSTNSEEPEIIELESPTVAPASTSNARKGKKKFQEE